jgi:hypothetical protein
MTGYRLLFMVSVLFGCFTYSPMSKAATGTYAVEYIITTPIKSDYGKIETCRYGNTCQIRSESLRLWINLYVFPRRHNGSVSIFGEPGCCFFSDGVRDLEINPSRLPIRVPIFVGRARRGLEIILNNSFGVLYLNFSDSY